MRTAAESVAGCIKVLAAGRRALMTATFRTLGASRAGRRAHALIARASAFPSAMRGRGLFAATTRAWAEPALIGHTTEVAPLVAPGAAGHRAIAARTSLRARAEAFAPAASLGAGVTALGSALGAELPTALLLHVGSLMGPAGPILATFGPPFETSAFALAARTLHVGPAAMLAARFIHLMVRTTLRAAATFTIVLHVGPTRTALIEAAITRALAATFAPGGVAAVVLAALTSALFTRGGTPLVLCPAPLAALTAHRRVLMALLRARATTLLGPWSLPVGLIGLHRPGRPATPEHRRQNRRGQPTLRDLRTHMSLLFRVPNAEVMPTRTCRDVTARGEEPR